MQLISCTCHLQPYGFYYNWHQKTLAHDKIIKTYTYNKDIQRHLSPHNTMYDQALLESVQELAALAEDGIKTAIAELPPNADQTAANQALDACQSAVEILIMIADTAQLSGFKKLCDIISREIETIRNLDPQIQTEFWPIINSWGHSALVYLQKPETAHITPQLLALVPLEQHGTLGHELDLSPNADTPTPAHNTKDAAVAANTAINTPTTPPETTTDTAQGPPTIQAADVALSLDPGLNPKLIEVFFQEAPQNAADFASHIEQVMRGNDVLKNLATAQRLAHNLKGSANMLGIRGLANLTHRTEDILGYLTREKLAPPPALSNTLQEATDCLEGMLDAVRGLAENPPNARRILQELTDWNYRTTNGQLQNTSIVPLPPQIEQEPEPIQATPQFVQPTDVALTMDPGLNPKLVEVFFQEAPANTSNFSAHIEKVLAGIDITKNLASAQRLAHNLKGSANMLGIKGLANLTHRTEDILEYLTKQQLAPPPPLAKTLQEASDCLEGMLDTIRGLSPAPTDAIRILQDLTNWNNQIQNGQLGAKLQPAEPAKPEPAVSVTSAPSTSTADNQGNSTAQDTAPTQPIAATKVLRVPTTTIDSLLHLAGELAITLERIQERLNTLRRSGNAWQDQDDLVQKHRIDLENLIDERNTSKIQQVLQKTDQSTDLTGNNLKNYEKLHSTVSNFIESIADLRHLSKQLLIDLSAVERIMPTTRHLKRDLQTAIMKMRMEPVSTISARLQRTVRQACRATDKQAELYIQGESVLIDSNVLEKLADPLMHMLRNSVDHGIEPSAVREAKGKSPVGSIVLSFTQTGQDIVAECIDDGGGLNYDSIRKTALKKGRSTEGLTNQQLANMILEPGFSTRTNVTQVSGRGVGMDVVQEAVTALKGSLHIGDAPTGGCRIELRLPTSFMTTHSIVVQSGTRKFAIPTSTILRVPNPQEGKISTNIAGATYQIGNQSLPLMPLASLLKIPSSNSPPPNNDDSIVILAQIANKPMAITIDKVVKIQNLVIKKLGYYLPKVPGISGLATLTDGSLVPVLNLSELLHIHTSNNFTSVPQPSTATKAATASRSNAPTLMIVDDSPTIRQALEIILDDAGFQHISARDGMEAVELLRQQFPKLMLCDLEMPRMNGIELVSYVRTTYGTELPIIMITTCNTQQHRQQAHKAGVNDYIVKPFQSNQLLTSIRGLLRS
ncbi:hypothetical protein TI04_07530 [Achromatium sp. WMS2]|nr:hypothetical protein TI04_07530 [Achromatium sp. WMS2]